MLQALLHHPRGLKIQWVEVRYVLVQLNQLNDVESYNVSELEGLSHLVRSFVSVRHFLNLWKRLAYLV